MSRHHWMYFGCQCSSARCSRLLLERLTLLGIFSAEIMMPRCQGHKGNKGHRGKTLNACQERVRVMPKSTVFAIATRDLSNVFDIGFRKFDYSDGLLVSRAG